MDAYHLATTLNSRIGFVLQIAVHLSSYANLSERLPDSKLSLRNSGDNQTLWRYPRRQHIIARLQHFHLLTSYTRPWYAAPHHTAMHACTRLYLHRYLLQQQQLPPALLPLSA